VAKLASYLHRTELLQQFGLNQVSQFRVDRQLGRLGSCSHEVGSALGKTGSVLPGPGSVAARPTFKPGAGSVLLPHVPSQLAHHRRGLSAKAPGDDSDGAAALNADEDFLPFF